jgi:hypothetical protein
MYANETDLIFTASSYDDAWQSRSEFYSDNELLKIEEVRLLSSLMLPLDMDQGLVVVHPLPCEIFISETIDLNDQGAQQIVSRDIRSSLDKTAFAHYDYVSLPPVWDSTQTYDYRQDALPSALQSRIFDSIDITDHLLVRGLYGLLRCAMLMNYRLFLEEATFALYVSLDASFSLVARRMAAEGHQNPTAYDAGEWIAKTFGEDYNSGRYFEDYYDDRIRAMHPHSRFGVFPFAPLAADDCYYLFKGLREVYRMLILRGGK